jgi:hypothetical protein
MVKESRNKIRSFHWKLFSQTHVDALIEFQLKALTENRSVYDVLYDLVNDYNKEHPVNATLLSESDLLRRLHGEGFTTTRQTIKKFRDQDVMKDDSGNRIWYTDGFNVVYNYEAVKRFLRSRGHSPRDSKRASKVNVVPAEIKRKVSTKLDKDRNASRVKNQRRA